MSEPLQILLVFFRLPVYIDLQAEKNSSIFLVIYYSKNIYYCNVYDNFEQKDVLGQQCIGFLFGDRRKSFKVQNSKPK